MRFRVVYDEPTTGGRLAAGLHQQIDTPPVVELSRLFENIGLADTVQVRVDELRAILAAVEEAS